MSARNVGQGKSGEGESCAEAYGVTCCGLVMECMYRCNATGCMSHILSIAANALASFSVSRRSPIARPKAQCNAGRDSRTTYEGNFKGRRGKLSQLCDTETSIN